MEATTTMASESASHVILPGDRRNKLLVRCGHARCPHFVGLELPIPTESTLRRALEPHGWTVSACKADAPFTRSGTFVGWALLCRHHSGGRSHTHQGLD